METVDAGTHAGAQRAQLRLDLGYGDWFLRRAGHGHRQVTVANPTSEDRKIDATSCGCARHQAGVPARPERTRSSCRWGVPEDERQPIRLLESYGLAATAFNRFEDVGFMAGGSVRAQRLLAPAATSGNPSTFRDRTRWRATTESRSC